jgi:hypothetical protein
MYGEFVEINFERTGLLPDFLGIGAQKAGTTWLYRNLKNHPGIWIPQQELHYFDRKRGNGFDDSWYTAQFERGEGKVLGDITPGYSVLDVGRIGEVHALLPHAKLVFLMRNPIERAWSQAVMYFSKRPGPPATEMPDEELVAFFERFPRQRLSDYLQTLENWGWFYPKDRIFVGFLEDISFSPDSLLEALYGFLDLDIAESYRIIRRKIRVGGAESIPSTIVVYLAHLHRERLRHLSACFGGYASFWSYCAESLISTPPYSDSIPYPFWESQMWGDWISSLEGSPEAYTGELQSNLLSLATR